MVTRSTDRASPLQKSLEFPETPKPKASVQVDNDPSNQKTHLNSTNHNQALRHLRQTYSLERRTFL